VTISADGLKSTDENKLVSRWDGILSMGGNGTVATPVRFGSEGRYRFTLRAEGTPLGGIYPHVVLKLDGRQIGEYQLDGPGEQTLEVVAPVQPGEQSVQLQFDNDEYDPPEDRNLRIRSPRIQKVEESRN